MLDVPDGLVEQLGDVVVVELVDDLPAVALADHEARGGAGCRSWCETAEPSIPTAPARSSTEAGPGVQPREDPQPARRGQRLHALGRRAGVPGSPSEPREVGRPVRHRAR